MSRFEFAKQESTGPWADGWYPGVIVPQYEAGANNTLFKTEDTLAQKGDSRNIRICFAVAREDKTAGLVTIDTRYISHTVNYRMEDLTDERIAEVQAYKERQGKTPVKNWSDKDIQRSFLSYAKLHELERVLGKELTQNGSGFDVEPLITCNADVRIYTEEKSDGSGKKFNSIGNVAPAGTRIGK